MRHSAHRRLPKRCCAARRYREADYDITSIAVVAFHAACRHIAGVLTCPRSGHNKKKRGGHVKPAHLLKKGARSKRRLRCSERRTRDLLARWAEPDRHSQYAMSSKTSDRHQWHRRPDGICKGSMVELAPLPAMFRPTLGCGHRKRAADRTRMPHIGHLIHRGTLGVHCFGSAA